MFLENFRRTFPKPVCENYFSAQMTTIAQIFKIKIYFLFLFTAYEEKRRALTAKKKQKENFYWRKTFPALSWNRAISSIEHVFQSPSV